MIKLERPLSRLNVECKNFIIALINPNHNWILLPVPQNARHTDSFQLKGASVIINWRSGWTESSTNRAFSVNVLLFQRRRSQWISWLQRIQLSNEKFHFAEVETFSPDSVLTNFFPLQWLIFYDLIELIAVNKWGASASNKMIAMIL